MLERTFPVFILLLLIVIALPNRTVVQRTLIILGGLVTEIVLLRVALGAPLSVLDVVLIIIGFVLMLTALTSVILTLTRFRKEL